MNCSNWGRDGISILMPVVSGCSRIDLNRYYINVDMTCILVMHVFSYWALAHGCCFDPQIKVKARWTNHELRGRGRLYIWAGLMDLEEFLV